MLRGGRRGGQWRQRGQLVVAEGDGTAGQDQETRRHQHSAVSLSNPTFRSGTRIKAYLKVLDSFPQAEGESDHVSGPQTRICGVCGGSARFQPGQLPHQL